jgi:hypothetical protein
VTADIAKHPTYIKIREMFREGEIGDWGAFAELVMLWDGILKSASAVAAVAHAAKDIERWKNGKFLDRMEEELKGRQDLIGSTKCGGEVSDE